MKNDRDQQLFYYQRELTFLREMGAVFSAQHPKVAKRLGLSKDHAADPHVERLIESFAFLTSYLQRDIDAQFPRVSQAILNSVFPLITRPIPSMGIMEFALDPSKKITKDHILPKGSQVYTDSVDSEQSAYFRTAAPVTFYPVCVQDAQVCSLRKYKSLSGAYKHTMGLVLTLKSFAGPFARLDIPFLRFFLHLSRNQALTFYSYIMRAQAPVAHAVKNDHFILHEKGVKAVGMDDTVLPCDDAHLGFALLQEYFCFPEKFLFIDVPMPSGIDSDELQVVLPLATSDSLSEYAFNAKSIRLHCAPIVNLFEKTTEPVLFDQKKVEYRLVPDRRQEKTTEIYSISDVYASRSIEEKEQVIAPYFSYDHQHLTNKTAMFWNARRVPSSQSYAGTNIYLSLVDKDATPLSVHKTVYARTLCSNRTMAADIQAGTQFFSDTPVPAKSIAPLFELTEPLYPSVGGVSQWKLVSMLATSYLTFSNSQEGVERLQSLLSVLSEMTLAEYQKEIQSLLALEVRPCVGRFARYKDWAGFYNGNAITLLIDEHIVKAEQLFLLLTLLDKFFATQAQMHTFCRLSVRTNARQGVWFTWQQQGGEKGTV